MIQLVQDWPAVSDQFSLSSLKESNLNFCPNLSGFSVIFCTIFALTNTKLISNLFPLQRPLSHEFYSLSDEIISIWFCLRIPSKISSLYSLHCLSFRKLSHVKFSVFKNWLRRKISWEVRGGIEATVTLTQDGKNKRSSWASKHCIGGI